MARSRFRDEPVEAPPADDSAGLVAAPGSALAVWEFWMGVLVCAALGFGTQLIVTAPDSIVTVFDLTNCYAAPPVAQPCERVAFEAGALSVAFNVWCGLLLIAVAAWLLWELWSAVAPKPITDDFLKLLDDSFGARLARSAHLAMDATRVGLRLHCRGRRRGPLRRAAAHVRRLVVETGQGADAAH